VDVWLGLRTWRDNNEMHGHACGANRRAGDSDEVRQPLPCHDFAIWPQALNFAVRIIHGISNISERLVWRLTETEL
jgi:hypothetical protein